MPIGTMYRKLHCNELLIKTEETIGIDSWYELELSPICTDESEDNFEIGIEHNTDFALNDGEFYNNEELYTVYSKEEMIMVASEILKYAKGL